MSADATPRWSPLRATALGGLVMTAIVAPRSATLPALVLMLAAGVAVPLGLALAFEDEPPAAMVPRILALYAPVGAAGGVLGWVFAPGSTLAIAGAALHAVTCALAGVYAAARVLRTRRITAADVGLLFLPPAAVWLLASRAGVPLAGFHEPVVTFTAAHFHVAGFAAPTVLAALGPRLPPAHRAGWLYRVAVVAVCAGVPLTAIGIATNHVVEQVSALVVATGMLAASATLIRFRAPSPLARALFIASGGTLLLTMSLAATFALTSSAGRNSSLHGAVELETMIRFHGAANAIGFALAALAALTLTPRPLPPSR